MIRTWLIRAIALLLLAVQAQPLAAAVFCDAAMTDHQPCSQGRDTAATAIASAPSADGHGPDCFRMGPCAAAGQWSELVRSDAVAAPCDAALRASDIVAVPRSLSFAPATPPPQA